jgi:UDPglucose 6-dehydrogenase
MKILGDKITYGIDQYEVLNEADALIVCTEWSVFRTPDFDKMKKLMKQPVVFDGRNVYDVQQMSELGFKYISIGRNPVK